MYILTRVRVWRHKEDGQIGVIMAINEDGSYNVILRHIVNRTLQGYVRMNYNEDELEEII